MGTSHRLILVAVMVLVCLAAVTTVFAQEQTGEAARKNSLEKGKSALMFQMLGQITLRDFEGGTISYKHQTADNRACRVGVTLDLRTQNGESTDQSADKRTSDLNEQTINLSLLKLFIPHAAGRVGFYYGLGPQLGLDRTASENKPATSFSYKSQSTVWSAGIDGVVGVEWFASRELSFVGEYGSSAVYSHSNAKSWSRQQGGSWELQNESKANNWELRPNTVRLGVAVYW